MSTQLVHKQAGGAGAQRQLQGALTEAPCGDLAVEGNRVMDPFVITTGAGRQDISVEAIPKATEALNNAKKCLVCQSVNIFNVLKHKGVQFPLIQLQKVHGSKLQVEGQHTRGAEWLLAMHLLYPPK